MFWRSVPQGGEYGRNPAAWPQPGLVRQLQPEQLSSLHERRDVTYCRMNTVTGRFLAGMASGLVGCHSDHQRVHAGDEPAFLADLDIFLVEILSKHACRRLHSNK